MNYYLNKYIPIYYTMPFKKKYAPKRRRNFRKKRRKKSMLSLFKTGQPFPRSYYTTLKYCTSVSLDASGVTSAVHTMSANGMYDPDITGTGHQPLGFDQFTPLYDHYYVYATRCKARFIAGDTGAQNVGISIDDNNSAITTLETIREQPDTVSTVLGGTNGNAAVKQLTKFVNIGKSLGKSYKSDENKGTSSANPSEQTYFNVWQEPIIAGTDPGACTVQVELTYYVCFTERKQLNQS